MQLGHYAPIEIADVDDRLFRGRAVAWSFHMFFVHHHPTETERGNGEGVDEHFDRQHHISLRVSSHHG